MSKVLELAKKLKALAEKGIGGEKVNAQTMLDALLERHHISLDAIEEDQICDYYFDLGLFYPNNIQFLAQVVRHVSHHIKMWGPIPKKVTKRLMLPGNYGVTCSPSEYIEITAKLDFYRRLFGEEVDVFFAAFVKANNIYSSEPAGKTSDLTPEEYLKWQRAEDLAAKIKSETFRKQITS